MQAWALCVSACLGAANPGCPFKSTSKAIPCAKKWSDQALLIPHEAIRQLNTELQATVESSAFDPVRNPWQGRLFLKWYTTFYHQVLQRHRQMKEEVYFPWMRSKLGEMPQATEYSDYDVQSALKLTEQAAKQLMEENDTDNANKLRAAAISMVRTVNRHLEEEERLYPPLLQKHFTAAEEDATIREIVEGLGLYGNKVFLPVVVQRMEEWGGPAAVGRFKANLPPPMRVLLEHVWMRHMQVHNWLTIRTLRGAAMNSANSAESVHSANSVGRPKPPHSTHLARGYALLLDYAEAVATLAALLLLALCLLQGSALVHGLFEPPRKAKAGKAD